MRLWHKDLISVLPRQQLLSQWRELSAIVGAINKNGTPNHLLVNKILQYDLSHFTSYANLILKEMHKRKYKISTNVVSKVFNICDNNKISDSEIYKYWHTTRYLKQCLYNLQEKYDCGGITIEEWQLIYENFYIYLKE
jgi:uncharacterized protein (TIGR02328 family)